MVIPINKYTLYIIERRQTTTFTGAHIDILNIKTIFTMFFFSILQAPVVVVIFWYIANNLNEIELVLFISKKMYYHSKLSNALIIK